MYNVKTIANPVSYKDTAELAKRILQKALATLLIACYGLHRDPDDRQHDVATAFI